jgi:hypothetical protein
VTFNELYAAMVHLADTHELDKEYSAFSSGGKKPSRRDQIEAVAHELAHALCFGRPMSTATLTTKLERLPAIEADRHELTALRVETIALRRLGLRIDGEYLRHVAAWRHEKAPPGATREKLTPAEQGIVGWFVSIVRAAAREAAR